MATVLPFLSYMSGLCKNSLGENILFYARNIAVVILLSLSLYSGLYNHYFGTYILFLINNMATVSLLIFYNLGS